MAHRSLADSIQQGLMNYATLKQAGTTNAVNQIKGESDLLQLQRSKSFGDGGGFQAPEGYVYAPDSEGKISLIKRLDYVSPVDKATIDYKKSMSGMPLGSTALDADGDAVPKRDPKQMMDSLDPQSKALVQGVLDYQIDPSKSTSMRGNQRQQLISLASSIDPTYDQTQFAARNKYRQSVDSGDIGGNIRAFNTATQHLGELNDSISGVPDNSVEPIEAGQRFAANTFGGNSPEKMAMTREGTALAAVTGELSNIFKKTGGTDVEIGQFLKAYNPNSTREAKREYIKTGVNLMRGRMSALGSDYERVMGKPSSKSFIYPETQSILDKLGGAPTEGANSNQGQSKYQVVEVH